MQKARISLMAAICLAAGVACAGDFSLKSPTISPGSTLTAEQVFNGFGCTGKNQSPALQWTAGPAGTKSYAVTVFDPDAPTGSGWWHWIVYNIPATVTELPAGAGDAAGKGLPSGAVQGRNDYGAQAFGGACPPRGNKPHRYVFTVYALKAEKLDVPPNASAAMIGYAINAGSLGHTGFTAMYGR